MKCRAHQRRNCSTCEQRARDRGYSNPANDTSLFAAASTFDNGGSYGGGGGSDTSTSCGGASGE